MGGLGRSVNVSTMSAHIVQIHYYYDKNLRPLSLHNNCIHRKSKKGIMRMDKLEETKVKFHK